MILGETWFRETGRLVMHLPGGYSRVAFERGGDMDVPTHVIPFHLRPLGSRFVVAMRRLVPEANDTLDDFRAAEPYSIEQLPE